MDSAHAGLPASPPGPSHTPPTSCHPLRAQHPRFRACSSCPAAKLMVTWWEQRGELRPLISTCCLTHTEQVARLADPALRPGRGRRPRFSLVGGLPSMPSASGDPLFCSDTSTVLRDRPTPHRRAMSDLAGPWPLLRLAHCVTGVDGVIPVLAHGVSRHTWGLRLRGVLKALAMSRPSILPSALLNGVGTPNANISQLNTRPTGAPVNASMAALRLATA